MRTQEAVWVGRVLQSAQAQVVLNLGSGSRHFRQVSKPYIEREIFEPLARRGVRVVHADLRSEEGVDVSGDLFDPAVQERLRQVQPQVAMACNMLEHLPEALRDQFPKVVDSLLPPGAVLVLTVPHSYPYHADPIDTLYRPSPDELARLFPGYAILEKRVIDSESYGDEFVAGGPWRMVRKILRLAFPFVRPMRWLSHAHRMLWLWRPYQLSGVVLKKPAA